MSIDIKIPSLGESVSEATIAKWLKKVGDAVKQDEPIVELETDKVTLEINAPKAGSLAEIITAVGESVKVGSIIGKINEGQAGKEASSKEAPAKETSSKEEPSKERLATEIAPKEIALRETSSRSTKQSAPTQAQQDLPLSPATRKWVDENQVNPKDITGTGKDGRLTKGDVISFLNAKPEPTTPVSAPQPSSAAGRSEERVRMSRLRQKIAERLKSAQNTAAILTTFNEIDMSAIINLRESYKTSFEKKHGVKLGFMGFFVKAAIQALKEIPAVNASIEGDELVYKNYYDISVAVGTAQGLVVPVIRNADQMSLADIEKQIGDFGARAKEGKLKLEELQGGTFTISNGGVYGSLMSTPILNPPQSGILGMHKTEKRPIVVNDQIVIRPMMYIALSYDHRVIDGKEAVTFLVRVKENIEDPQRMLLGV
jgi:2-oxoglutarate dehydrogenase E2 component (dihydrolipoamide succinyltransferase)